MWPSWWNSGICRRHSSVDKGQVDIFLCGFLILSQVFMLPFLCQVIPIILSNTVLTFSKLYSIVLFYKRRSNVSTLLLSTSGSQMFCLEITFFHICWYTLEHLPCDPWELQYLHGNCSGLYGFIWEDSHEFPQHYCAVLGSRGRWVVVVKGSLTAITELLIK